MKWKDGDVIHGFRVQRTSPIPEVDSDAYLMEHEQSGARLLYLDTADDNKVFYICFRTTPDNSKGTPHIMEHSTLCGSRKFPLKEPFVELAKGSLNTFLNAITWPDKTMYPVASRNAQDFHNLMDVYLDAVFYPNCLKDPQILMQEGWHYELENRDDPIIYKGVVYNEMKGALSSPEAIMEDCAMAELFPDTTYGVESGGDPDVIPSLSFREFTEFHRRFYHPSNSYIYLYGDMDIEETLRFIDEEYLSHFRRHAVDSAVKTQSPFAKRKLIERSYGIAAGDEEKNKAIHSLYIACSDHMSTAESLGLKILNYTLVEMDGAPLKKAVVDAGIGSDLTGSYSDSYKQPVWEIETTGSEPDRQQKFAQVLDGTLRTLALNGLDREMLAAALNRTEFTLRESDYQGRPKGLFYGVRVMDMWLYDRDPMAALRYIDDLKALREGLDKGFFESLLLKYVLKNSHQVLITMKAEKGLTEKKNRETEEKLAAYKHSLNEEQLDEIIAQTKALKERQASGETAEALATIPILSRSDLKRDVRDAVFEESTAEGVPHLHYAAHTSGISYINLFFTLYGLTAEDVPYAYLLASLLSGMDTENHTYQELTRLSNSHTGGLTFSVNSYSRADDDSVYVPVLIARGKALTSQLKELMALLGDILNHTRFTDLARLKEILMEEKADWDMSVFSRGHTLVMHRVLSYFSETEKFREAGSLSFYYFLSDLVKRFDADGEAIAARLADVASRIFTRKNLTVQTVGEAEERQKAETLLPLVTGDMPEGEETGRRQFHFPEPDINEGILTSGKVQYVVKGGNFRRHGFAYTGALQVMETILRYEYLWKKIRVQGGAYGAFTQFALNGNALICSYRDPNLRETIDAYKEAADYLRHFTISDREMTKYVIGTMAPAETQYTPFMKGEQAMMFRLCGITKEDRLRVRREIIDCTQEDIRRLADLMASVMEEPYLCVMGGEEKIRSEKELFGRIVSLPE